MVTEIYSFVLYKQSETLHWNEVVTIYKRAASQNEKSQLNCGEVNLKFRCFY